MKKILIFVGVALTVFVLSGCGSSKTGTSASSSPPAISGPSGNSATAPTRPPGVHPAAFKKRGWLAFVYNGLLYDLDGATGQVRQLTRSGRVIHPVWSHDGRWLAYVLTTPDYGSDILSTTGTLWLVRRDGTGAHQVEGLPGTVTSASDITTFAWSPSADVLAVAGAHGLWLAAVKGQARRLVATRAWHRSFAWSPDGRSLAYNDTLPWTDATKHTDVLYTLNTAGGKPVRRLVAQANNGIVVAGWWSNGKGLLYWGDPEHMGDWADGLNLHTLRLGGTKPQLLAWSLTYEKWRSFSPRGRLLIVKGSGREVWANKELTVFDVVTGNGVNLPNPAGKVAIDASFSPNGQRIVFVTAKDMGANVGGIDSTSELAAWVDTRTLWIENADGSDAHPLPSAGRGVYEPAWSRDGESILYVRHGAIWIISTAGRKPQKIVDLHPASKDLFEYYGYVRYDNFSWFQPGPD